LSHATLPRVGWSVIIWYAVIGVSEKISASTATSATVSADCCPAIAALCITGSVLTCTACTTTASTSISSGKPAKVSVS
jgi:hypothetical protein